jgi:DNA topoisomerase II
VHLSWSVQPTLSFRQTSFVNSIATTKGGTHVTYVVDQIVGKILEAVNKKNKAAPVKPFQVKSHLWVFVNCLVENPTFDSQTKENMTLKVKSFGSECNLGEKFFKAVLKSGVVDTILAGALSRSQAQLAKTTGGAKRMRLTGIPKLDDANEAGGRNSEKCTLILTEGDSAKALAISGLSVVGRDYFGVFPLRGKLLNVREANHKQIVDNAEIKAIVQIVVRVCIFV